MVLSHRPSPTLKLIGIRPQPPKGAVFGQAAFMAFRTPQAVGSYTFSPPPLDGSLSLPEIYDYHATHNPDHPIFVYKERNGGVTTILWWQVVRAIHCAARYVQSSLRAENDHDSSTVITILANTDTFTYFALVVGILRAGYQAFPISTRNSPIAVAHLLRQAKSKYMFVSDDPVIQRLATATCAQPVIGGLAGANLHLLPVPSFESLFDISDEMFEPLTPMKHPGDMAPALILHSSGSTAFPKPIIMTHQALIRWGLLPFYGDVDICGHTLAGHSLPLYHAMGATLIAWTMSSGLIVASFSPGDPPVTPTPERVFSGALETNSTILFCVPSFIETWSHLPENIVVLKRFRAVIFAGAPMQHDVGKLLASEGVNLIPFYGATEIGCVTKFIPCSNIYWDYFEFSSHCSPAFVPYQDNVWQLLIVDCPTLTPNVINTKYNGIKAYDTNDLLVQHPSIPTLWRVYGRCDEQLMHSTGEKTNPVPIESILLRHSKIRGAVMFGRGRPHAGILLDLIPDCAFNPVDKIRLASFRSEIWPLVEEANSYSPNYSRLFQEMILVTNPSKPFEYTAKGTPRRKVVLEAYEDEIEQVYASVEASTEQELLPPSTWSQPECIIFVRKVIENVMKCTVNDNEDIFQAGCDSFQATWIRNVILEGLRRSVKLRARRNIPQNFVYFNPTVAQLGTYLAQMVQHGHSSVALCRSSGKMAEMESLVRKYCSVFPLHQPQGHHVPNTGGEVVLLTGTTGFLGSFILKELVETPGIVRIYALNRRDKRGKRSILARHISGFHDRGLDISILSSSKVVLLEGDTTAEYFDLGKDAYQELQVNVTHIIHNAWCVDFNVSLSSMEPLVAGTRRIIDFALGSPRSTVPRLAFISTLSVFTNWTRGTPVPEALNPRSGVAMGLGYTESKWIAERVLVKAAEHTPLEPIIIRLGHVCGGPNGYWDPIEWVPTLVRSGQLLGCLPRPDGNISWVPVHIAAAAIVEMRTSQDIFLNLAHPNPVSSSSIFEAFASALGVQLVCYGDWLLTLEASKTDSPEGSQGNNPALPLLEFYRSLYRPSSNIFTDREAFGFPTPSIERALASAPKTLNNLPALSGVDINSWIMYWRKMGSLSS